MPAMQGITPAVQSSSLAAALMLAEEYGLPVFPCRSRDEVINGEKRNAKSPLTPHGFEDASTNLQRIERWFHDIPDALIGVPTGAPTKLFVVDVDPLGAEWYRENAARLACSRIHRTRRGWHLLYRMPAIQLSNSTGGLPPGVDVRGAGGFVIWWPAHGLEATGDLQELNEPPAWLLEVLKKPAPAARANGGTRTKYGQGDRHKALLKFASSLRHKGVVGVPLEAALIAWNLEYCEPPQDEADVRRIARDYSDKPEDADFARVSQEARDVPLVSLRALSAKPMVAKSPLVEGLLFPGAWLVVGRPKIGKSWLILQLALAVAENGTFLGFSCEAVGAEVLCIFGEDDDSRIQSRLTALGVANAPANCYVINRASLLELAQRFAGTFTFAQFLEICLTEHPRIRLILVDTETTVRQVWRGEQTEPDAGRVIETDYKQTSTFDEIALRRGVLIALVNHASKRKGEWIDPHESINRSNTAFAGCSGSIAMADPPDADPFDTKAKTRLLAVRGRDLKEDLLLAIRQQEDMPYFISEGVYSEVRQTQVEAQIMEALEELTVEVGVGEYVKTDDIAATIGKSRGTVQRAITRMLSKGRTRWKKSRVVSKRGKGGGLRLDTLDA